MARQLSRAREHDMDIQPNPEGNNRTSIDLEDPELLELEIVLEEALREPGLPRLPHDKVVGWMASDNIEVLGALDQLLRWPGIRRTIDPPLTPDEIFKFQLHYYERCLLEDPQGADHADLRYSAATSFVGWFDSVWERRPESDSKTAFLKKWIERMYIQGDTELRICMETAMLEHLFADRRIRKYFSDWRNDPVLGSAYSACCMIGKVVPVQKWQRRRQVR